MFCSPWQKWLKNVPTWIRSRRQRAARKARHRACRPSLETLECRTVPTVTNLRTSTNFSTIQAAISDPGTINGDTLLASTGTFNESVNINKSVILEGVQHGVDARTRSGSESIVSNTSTPFVVNANNVTIDGFTVEGANNPSLGYGIILTSGFSGAHVLNNIIQNNIDGLSLANNPAGSAALIQHNLFQNNNTAGSNSGDAIYTDQFVANGNLANVTIDANSFLNNANAGVLLGSTSAALSTATNITISNNTLDTNGNAILLFNTTSSVVNGNTIVNSVGSQLVFGGGVNGLLAYQNFIQNGATRGVRVGDFGGGATNSNIKLFDNNIQGNATNGLEIDSAAGSYTGVFEARLNWWGSATGPTFASNPGGTGQAIVDPATQVRYRPWLTSATDTLPVTPGFQGDFTQNSGNTLTPTALALTATEGTPLAGTVATFTTLDTFDTTADLSATINWGDGTTTTATVTGPTGGPFTLTGSHTYADEGTFTTKVTVTDPNLVNTSPLASATITGSATGSAAVAEADVLVAGPAITITPTAAQSFTGTVATFTDTGYPANVASDFTASINWGDGTVTPGTVSGGPGTFSIAGTHTYASPGFLPLTVVMTDNPPGTASATATGTANIAASPSTPLTATGVPVNGFEFTPLVNVPVAVGTPGGPHSSLTATIFWGDGTSSAATLIPSATGFTVAGTHTYTDESTARLPGSVYPISVVLNEGAQTITATAGASILEELLPGGVRGTPQQRFISELYRDLLHRAVDPGGLAGWTSALNGWLAQGKPMWEAQGLVAYQIMTEPGHEYYYTLVRNFYQFYLHRATGPGDQGMVDYMVNILATGVAAWPGRNDVPDRRVRWIFLMSDEYQRLNAGPDNTAYVTAIYRDTFGRGISGDPGAAAYIQQLNAGTTTRSQVSLDILLSDEYARVQAFNDYRTLLDREPNTSADFTYIEYLVQQMQGGLPEEVMHANIIGDPQQEFYSKTVP
jgi:hypothetical protein